MARRFTTEQWVAVETGVARASQRMLALLPAPRAAALTEGTVTIDIDATDVEVYGRKKTAWTTTMREALRSPACGRLGRG